MSSSFNGKKAALIIGGSALALAAGM